MLDYAVVFIFALGVSSASILGDLKTSCEKGIINAEVCCRFMNSYEVLKHPTECNKYYMCINKEAYQYECTDGHIFKENQCIESDEKCSSEESEEVNLHHHLPYHLSKECREGKKDPKICCRSIPIWMPGNMKNPNDCGTFYRCHFKIPILKRCPWNLQWSVKYSRCLLPRYAQCTIDISTTTEEVFTTTEEVTSTHLETTTSEEEITTLGDESTISEETHEDETTTQEIETATPEEAPTTHETTIHEDETTTNEEVTTTHEEETSAHEEETTTHEAETTIHEEETTTHEVEITTHEETPTTSEEEITTDEEENTSHEVETTTHEESTIHEDETTNSEEETITSEEEVTTPEEGTGTSEEEQTTTSVETTTTPIVDEDCLFGRRSAEDCCRGIPYWIDVLLRNPEDCGTFYQCVHEAPMMRHCPQGLHWNVQTNTCDWPTSANCETSTDA